MTAVIRVPISPSPNYLNRTIVLAMSAQRAGGLLAEARIEAFVSPDRPAAPRAWVDHLSRFNVDWIDVPQDRFEIHSYGATGIERFRVSTPADVIVMADADLLFLAGLDEPIDRCATEVSVLGVTAYRSPFTVASYPQRQELDRRSCWSDLFSRVGVDLPELCGIHPAAFESDWDPDFSQCPPYFNYGMLFVQPGVAAVLGDSLYDEHRRLVEHFSGVHSGQLAFSTALARHHLASEQLQIRYNFPNQEPYVDAYPADFADVRVLHYMSPKGFSKESDLDTPRALRRWVQGHHGDRVHRLLADEFGRYLPALDECPWNEYL